MIKDAIANFTLNRAVAIQRGVTAVRNSRAISPFQPHEQMYLRQTAHGNARRPSLFEQQRSGIIEANLLYVRLSAAP
jgi:hypothetical protein